ncbi:ATP-binding protein [Novosphingobium rosa]|uniref:ATP-binding protein n=1 Tax=Novosphingobium rosa TaxID=76978 RepID=UPI00082C7E7C|nr:ATP-binding protein [Novosphingobium rosa]
MRSADHSTRDDAPDFEEDLIEASEKLAAARSLEEVVSVLRVTARKVVGADGIAVIIREPGRCFYAVEDAMAPLWAGKRFDENSCISGWAMQHLQTVRIADTTTDERIPQEAYAPTFVRSLVMVPIGAPRAVAALGAYWAHIGHQPRNMVRRLESLARLAGIAIENARLLDQVKNDSRQRSLMVAAGRIGLWSIHIASGELDTSPMCRINFGRDPDQPFTYAELRAAIHPDDRARVDQALAESLATGGDYDIDYRLITPAGETRWIGIRAQPTYASDGTPLTLDGLSLDITARKKMEEALQTSAATLEHLVHARTQELITAQEALRQAQKLDAMGQLTGGVAHDFNNLLAPIIGGLDLLQRRQVGGEREQRIISGALQSADRARTLVQRLLAFARRQPLSPEPVDIAALVAGMRELLLTTLGPQVALVYDVAPGLPLALADYNQVEMALLNLSVNARDAMPDGGLLKLSADARTVGPGHAEVGPGQYIVITVTDTGVGMDVETRTRAIEPFYSTKGVGKGTGLGLSMAHGLASQLGGALTIRSAPGKGTVIGLWLPVSKALAAQPAASVPTQTSAMTGVALLVDDEPLVRMSTADMLTELGFEVIEASSGPEALACLRQEGKVDIVITDHLMPGMTGVDLARAVTQGWPDVKVMLVSGYSDARGIEAGLPLLEKPFRQADLAARLEAVLPQLSLPRQG